MRQPEDSMDIIIDNMFGGIHQQDDAMALQRRLKGGGDNNPGAAGGVAAVSDNAFSFKLISFIHSEPEAMMTE